MKKNILIAVIGVLVSHIGYAQMFASLKKTGDELYNRGDYYAAAQYYEEYLTGKKTEKTASTEPYNVEKQQAQAVKKPNEEVYYKLAESYRHLNNYAEAVKWYSLSLQADPLAKYWYGVSLRANGKYDEAMKQLQEFIVVYKGDDAYKEKAKRELDNINFIREQAGVSKKIVVDKFSGEVNGTGANYAASFAGDIILFTSTRPDSVGKKKVFNNQLYIAKETDGKWGNIEKIVLKAKQEQYGAASFSPGGNTLFFTAWSMSKEGKKQSYIYVTERKGDEWSEPLQLNENINEPGSSARQPFVTADGRYLFFASDKKGGVGGFDIWYAPLSGTTTGKSINAGKEVNTKDNEEAPFYHDKSKTLVFASNGRIGMGGYDLYSSKGIIGKDWEEAVNMGEPVNSIKDDLYFIVRQDKELFEKAVFSSDRSSACCLELFTANALVADTVITEVAAVDTVAPPVKEPEVVVKDNKLVLEHVYFGFNKADILEESYGQLDIIVDYLESHPDIKVEIGAHTDGVGSASYNLKLSEARAKACVRYIVSKGIDPSRLIAKGYGECCPVEAETMPGGKDIPEARKKNRRVEMKIVE